jgi:hypothetical protein
VTGERRRPESAAGSGAAARAGRREHARRVVRLLKSITVFRWRRPVWRKDIARRRTFSFRWSHP